jgi:hypothetical protein
MRKTGLFTLAVAILIIMSLLITAVPAFAQTPTADTTVTIKGGDPSPPIIKCKWESPDGDTVKPNTQIKPVIGDPYAEHPYSAQVCAYAVVTHNVPSSVGEISCDLWEPLFAGQPPTAPTVPPTLVPPEGYKYKAKFILTQKMTLAEIQTLVNDCDGNGVFNEMDIKCYLDKLVTAGRLTLDPRFTTLDVAQELYQGLAWLYTGCFTIVHPQPCGWYYARVNAQEAGTANYNYMWNVFEFVCVPAIAIDFSVVNFGTVKVCESTMVAGDCNFVANDGKPSVRNVGNVPVNVTVKYSDMYIQGHYGDPAYALGQTGGNWNVNYDFRMGMYAAGDPTDMLSPLVPLQTGTTGKVCPICNVRKLEFSIHVLQIPPNIIPSGWNNQLEGKVWLGAVQNNNPAAPVAPPCP